jgi:hypothetical protein
MEMFFRGVPGGFLGHIGPRMDADGRTPYNRSLSNARA